MTEAAYQNKPLDEWLSQQKLRHFPGGGNYYKRYSTIKDWLTDNVYNEVEAAALFSEVADGKEPIYLNKHGLAHVECVTERAHDLVRESCQLSPYEVYLLLVAILIHDAGNIYGRKNHEQMCQKIVYALGAHLGDDDTEKRVVARIASAHGGVHPDTFDSLQEEVPLYSQKVREQLLASILRLADELADDRSRASRFVASAINVGDSRLHHAYSNSLVSVEVVGHDIRLSYELTRNTAIRLYERDGKHVFLFDEILERDKKMFLELVYCRRYSRSLLRVDRILAKIEVFDDFGPDRIPQPLMDSISFALQEKGYPPAPQNGIYGLCPELTWDGEKIKDRIEGRHDD